MRSLSLPWCLDDGCTDSCLNSEMFCPGGHTYTSPCSPGQLWLSGDLFCLIQHIPAMPRPHLPLAPLSGSQATWLQPRVEGHGAEPAFLLSSLVSGKLVCAALFSQLRHCSVQRCWCRWAVKHFMGLSIISNGSCFLF